jgi:hypothetical protein
VGQPSGDQAVVHSDQATDLDIFRSLALQQDIFVEDVQYIGSDVVDNEKIHYILLIVSPRQKNMEKYYKLLTKISSLEGIVKVKVAGDSAQDDL